MILRALEGGAFRLYRHGRGSKQASAFRGFRHRGVILAYASKRFVLAFSI
jgi:hypothetical protein